MLVRGSRVLKQTQPFLNKPEGLPADAHTEWEVLPLPQKTKWARTSRLRYTFESARFKVCPEVDSGELNGVDIQHMPSLSPADCKEA